MKGTNRKLRTRFGPETRFDVQARSLRARETAELERLKERLLAEILGADVDAEQCALLQRAANDAVALAWASGYALLLLPELLEEKARAAQSQYQKQKEIRRRSAIISLAV